MTILTVRAVDPKGLMFGPPVREFIVEFEEDWQVGEEIIWANWDYYIIEEIKHLDRDRVVSVRNRNSYLKKTFSKKVGKS